MEASIARAESDPFGSICHLDAQMGREAAAAFDRQMAKRDPAALDAPFAGLPFLAKDLGNIARDLQSVSPWSYPADIAGAKA